VVAVDREHALSAARETRPSAVVVDDVAGDAWDWVRELRRLPGMSHTPVVVIVDEEGGFLARLRRPKAHTLRKPFAELEFQQLVTRLVGRSIG
jgi:DNA-binding response OmpR family regulator